ncbi:phosphatidylserine decarboxylase [Halarcobacter bivalviorum]|uniref:Phosphatidylserine decarboxylase n=1 Tax=Halarcobacter bivalviorum TaxID=663364 RepID=A0AAX2A4Q2_9BACT|nr:phosphatidylserine decarboxylase [Halarcobacter bivalviorum]AXH11570.1 putative phosphatidylserine decarboxylase [Halarcobacter bivalviorum]RXK08895.1 hypothetical protein CRV05_12665 [Halarcobacter bivalviorum]
MFNNLIAKEGQSKVFYLFLAFVLFFILDCEFLSFIFFVLTIWFALIYRNKRLEKDYDISDILAPISGKVSTIDKRDNKIQIIIDVSLCDNHILRAPKNGNFILIHQKGLNTLLDSLKAKKLNEKATIKYSDMNIELISSLYGTDISIFSNEALMGDKLGVFLHGQVIVELDNSQEILVNIGNKVESGKTVLARAK